MTRELVVGSVVGVVLVLAGLGGRGRSGPASAAAVLAHDPGELAPAEAVTCETFFRSDLGTGAMINEEGFDGQAMLSVSAHKNMKARTWDDLGVGLIVGGALATGSDSKLLKGLKKNKFACLRFTVATDAGKYVVQSAQRVDRTGGEAGTIVRTVAICDEAHDRPMVIADTQACKAPRARFASITTVANGRSYYGHAVRADSNDQRSLLMAASLDLAGKLTAAGVAIPSELRALSVGSAQPGTNATSTFVGYGLWFPCVVSGCCRAF